MDKQPKNATNSQNLADHAAEKVKPKENATPTLKNYLKNHLEQNLNYAQLKWLGEEA